MLGASPVGDSFEAAGGIGDLPLEIVKGGTFLSPERTSVEEKLGTVPVQSDDDPDGLTFFSGPVPMRGDGEDRTIPDPFGLPDKSGRFGKPASVQDAKDRGYGRP
jgi:hypothetical protein